MLGSLRARLIVSFALVVMLAVFLAGAAALFLLRDEEQATARERYGQFAEPLNQQVAALLERGDSLQQVEAFIASRAIDLDVRVLLLDGDLLVVYDTTDELDGQYVLSFENRDLQVTESGGSRYKWANYNGGDARLTLFAPPTREEASGGPFAPTTYMAVVATPQSTLNSAWLDLAPRLALAGGIALFVSFGVSYLISRSISGPLARITEASVQMARGDYDVHIPIHGQDEVGRLSEAFNRMAREVNGQQRMMHDLLANVSHELKTPLTSIQGFSQAILDGAVTDETALKEACDIINHEANRMRSLVDDLLLLGQIESGQVPMQQTQIEVAPLLERMIERFQWSIREGGITVGLSVDPLPPVAGDERRLEQVFANLLENAVRHTPIGGTITVSGLALQGAARGKQISVGVHNTGSFIPKEDLERVFERFFQVDRARARKGGSSGLGLAIVSEIVEAHGGTIRAVSDERRGTEFIVTLPGAPAGARVAAAPGAAKPKRAAKAAKPKREAPA